MLLPPSFSTLAVQLVFVTFILLVVNSAVMHSMHSHCCHWVTFSRLMQKAACAGWACAEEYLVHRGHPHHAPRHHPLETDRRPGQLHWSCGLAAGLMRVWREESRERGRDMCYLKAWFCFWGPISMTLYVQSLDQCWIHRWAPEHTKHMAWIGPLYLQQTNLSCAY